MLIICESPKGIKMSASNRRWTTACYVTLIQKKYLRHYRTPLRYDDTARFLMVPHSIGPICRLLLQDLRLHVRT